MTKTPESPTPDRIKVTEEEMAKLISLTSESPDRYLDVNLDDVTITAEPENMWSLELLAEWRGV